MDSLPGASDCTLDARCTFKLASGPEAQGLSHQNQQAKPAAGMSAHAMFNSQSVCLRMQEITPAQSSLGDLARVECASRREARGVVEVEGGIEHGPGCPKVPFMAFAGVWFACPAQTTQQRCGWASRAQKHARLSRKLSQRVVIRSIVASSQGSQALLAGHSQSRQVDPSGVPSSAECIERALTPSDDTSAHFVVRLSRS